MNFKSIVLLLLLKSFNFRLALGALKAHFTNTDGRVELVILALSPIEAVIAASGARIANFALFAKVELVALAREVDAATLLLAVAVAATRDAITGGLDFAINTRPAVYQKTN